MAAFVPEIGSKSFINMLLTQMNSGTDVKVRLYTNNYTPVFGSVIGNFTEAAFPGYAAINVNDWMVGADVSSLRVQLISAAVKTFTYSGGGSPPYTVYGYYITSVAYGLMYAELGSTGPYSLSVTGQQLTLTPLIEVGNC